MAKFTPELPVVGTPNYQYSQAPNRADVYAAQDTSLGTLAGNVGRLADLGIKAVDNTIQENIKQDLYASIDKLRAEQGGEATPEVAAAITAGERAAKADPLSLGGSVSVPSGVTDGVSSIKKLNAAYQSGRLGNSYYYAQLEQLVRGMRNKYPGYRDQIDSMVSSITGVTPANALRSSILHDMNSMASAHAANTNRLTTMWRQDQQYLGAVPFEQYVAKFGQYQAQVATMKAHDYQIQAAEHEISLANAKDARMTALATKTLQQKHSTYVSQTVQKTMNMLNQEALTLRQKGANASATEISEFVNRATTVRNQMYNSMVAAENAPLPSGKIDANGNQIPSDKTYAYFVPPEARKKARDEAIAGLDTIIESFTGKNTDMAAVTANMVKYQNNSDFLRLTQKYPIIRNYNAIKSALGEQAMTSVIMAKNAALMDPLTKAVSDSALFNLYDHMNPQPAPPISETLNNINETHPTNPGRTTAATLEAVKQMIMTVSDPRVAARAVQSVYGDPNFFPSLSRADQQRVYRTLGSEPVTARMKALGGEAYQTYSAWMLRNFVPVFKENVDEAQGYQTDPRMVVTFDPSSLSFHAQEKNPRVRPPTDPLVHRQSNKFFVQYDMALNQNLALIRPILKDIYGAQAPQVLLDLLNNSGNGFDYTADKPNILSDIIRAIGNAIIPEGNPNETKRKETPAGENPSGK